MSSFRISQRATTFVPLITSSNIPAWQPDVSNNIYYFGNVGVNNVNPQNAVDICGNINILSQTTDICGNIYGITPYYNSAGTPINNSFYPGLSSANAEKAVSIWQSRAGFPLSSNPNRSAWSPQLVLFAVTAEQGIGRIITTPDGINWTRQTTGINLTNCNNGAGNLITCTSTTGLTSGMSINLVSGTGSVPSLTTVSGIIDGLTFQTNNTVTGLSNSTLNADSQYFGIIWCQDLSGIGYFIASRTTGTGTQIVTSTNGSTWTARTTPSGFDDPYVFSYSPSLKRVICGRGGSSSIDPSFMYSNNGITWTTVSNPVPENFYFESAWSDELGLFCSVAFSGTSTKKVILSRDGITWTPVDISANVSNSYSVVRWSSELGIFCALIRNTTPNVMISSDGVNWQFYSTPSPINYRNLVWSPQLRIFVAISESGTNRLAYSYDGKIWAEKDISGYIDSNLRGISWSPELGFFCLNGQTGTNVVATSTFKARPPTSYNFFDSSFNNINEVGMWTFQSFSRGVPVTKSGSSTITVNPGENWIICATSADVSCNLPSASLYPGLEITLKNNASFRIDATVLSRTTNQITGTLLPNTIGSWVTIVSNGTNWNVENGT